MLVLLIVKKLNARVWGSLQWYNINTKFNQNQSSSYRVLNIRTDTTSPRHVHLTQLVQRELQVFENEVLRRIFGLKQVEVQEATTDMTHSYR
jgi:hypothetical protein